MCQFSLCLLKFLRISICWVSFITCHLIFFLTASVFQGTLHLALDLVGIYSAVAASMWALTKFLYSSFGVCVPDIFWRVSNMFFTVIIYLLLISLLVSEDQSYLVVLKVSTLFLHRLRHIYAVTILWSEDTPPKEEYASQFRAQFIHLLFMRM